MAHKKNKVHWWGSTGRKEKRMVKEKNGKNLRVKQPRKIW